MKTRTLVRCRILFYSSWALINAWCTGMSGVKWASMGWEEQSCLVGGILMSWTGMMVAYFDKSVWKLDEEQRANGKPVDKPVTPSNGKTP